MDGWEETLRKCLPASIPVLRYHGATKVVPEKTAINSITLTTYHTFTRHAEKLCAGEGFLRCVLDEAHEIRNQYTKVCVTLCEKMNADIRWFVSGTPGVNRMSDLFPVMQFLEVAPLNDFDWFNRLVLRPIASNDNSGVKNIKSIMEHMMLRRTKAMEVRGQPLVALPPKTEKSIEVKL